MCLPVKPFKIEREWEHAGLKCAVVQNRAAGFRCGYVRVPPGHSLHGKNYDVPNVSVHGGLTFSDKEPCAHDDGIGWWFGFDCAHLGDADHDPNANIEDFPSEWKIWVDVSGKYARHGHFWTEAEVVGETESLAEQVANIVE